MSNEISTKKALDFRIVIAAILGIAIIECFAIAHGINGTVMKISIGLIAGLAGLSLPQLKFRSK